MDYLNQDLILQAQNSTNSIKQHETAQNSTKQHKTAQNSTKQHKTTLKSRAEHMIGSTELGGASGRLNSSGDHLVVFLGAAFFWAFWAALSWAFCWAFLSLLTLPLLVPAFLAARAFLRSLISLTASSARAFLSSGLAVLSLRMSSRVTPSMALSFLKALFFLFLPTLVCLSFLWSLLQAVVHLSLWAFSLRRPKSLVLLLRYRKGLPSLATYLMPFPGYIFHSLNEQSSVLMTILQYYGKNSNQIIKNIPKSHSPPPSSPQPPHKHPPFT